MIKVHLSNSIANLFRSHAKVFQLHIMVLIASILGATFAVARADREPINLSSLDKVDAMVLTARLGATEQQLERNLTSFRSNASEFQKRRDLRTILDWIQAEAKAAGGDKFRIDIQSLPVAASSYDFKRKNYLFCLPDEYYFSDRIDEVSSVRAINGGAHFYWPNDFSTNGRGIYCGGVPSSSRLGAFRDRYTGSWLNPRSSLTMPVEDVDIAEKIRNLSDAGKLAADFNCSYSKLVAKSEGSKFTCYVYEVFVNTNDGQTIGHWWYANNKWEFELGESLRTHKLAVTNKVENPGPPNRALEIKPKTETSAIKKELSVDEAYAAQTISEAPWVKTDAANQAALKLDRAAVADIQARLSVMGYDPKGIDGSMGRGSRSAISAWQDDQGIPSSGYLDARQLEKLKTLSATAFTHWISDPGNKAILDRASKPRKATVRRSSNGWYYNRGKKMYCKRTFIGIWCQAAKPRR